MNDLISRTEAISKIEEVLFDLDDMPSAQQWIPCDEKLPPENHEVLVSIYNENSEPWYAVTKREGDFWKTLGHTKNIVGEMAWMELPKPYEVEE